MFAGPEEAIKALKDEALTGIEVQRERLERIRRWSGPAGQQPVAYQAKHTSRQADGIMEASKAPWLLLVVDTYTQALLVDNYTDSNGIQTGLWSVWQSNRMDARQVPLMADLVRYGQAMTLTLSGVNQLTGEPELKVQTFSPRRSWAVYTEDSDIYPEYAVFMDVIGQRVRYRIVDDAAVYTVLSRDKISPLIPREMVAETPDYEMVGYELHGSPVTPVVKFSIAASADGDEVGLVEPLLTTAARLNLTTAHRMFVQVYGAHQVRTATGLAAPEDYDEVTASMTDEERAAYDDARRVALGADDILIGEGDAKFGVLPGSPLEPYNSAYDTDLRTFAAVSHLPPHYLQGQIANVSADALVAARQSMDAYLAAIRAQVADSHEANFRLWAAMSGDVAAAREVGSQVVWRQPATSSFAQTVDALGKVVQMLGMPEEIVWEQIPGMTPQTIQRALDLVESGGGVVQKALAAMAQAAGVEAGASDGSAPASSDGAVADV